MTTVFISHAGEDDALATDLERWLHTNGFEDVFVDHGVDGIRVGEKWRRALESAVGSCRVVICLVSENWLNSKECDGEFIAARYMGKRIMPILVVDPDSPETHSRNSADEDGQYRDGLLRRVLREDQGIDIRPAVQDGRLCLELTPEIAEKLAKGLSAAGAKTRVGLDPEAFEIDPRQVPCPFPGLAAFDDQDCYAAIFYGRGPEIANCIERLRQARAKSDFTPIGIIGASGSGKSSLMRAGVLPRLRRERPWICLRAFRPGSTPLVNFADALRRTFAYYNQARTTGAILSDLRTTWASAQRDKDGILTYGGLQELRLQLDEFADELRRTTGRATATCLIALDQAEELVESYDEGSDVLADYLRAAAQKPAQRASGGQALGDYEADGGWQIIFTIRTDCFPLLQQNERFRGIEASGIDLRSLPVFRFDNVIDGPAARYGAHIEGALVDELVGEEPSEDVLPLLAFTLQRLWAQCADDRTIRLEHYRDLGGISGILEDAAERAMRRISPADDAPLPAKPPSAQTLANTRRLFFPNLVSLNSEGEPSRHIYPYNNLDEDARAIADSFVRWRLLVLRGDEGEVSASGQGGETIEVAHEAIFREWRRLQNWLEPERDHLDALRSVQIASNIWNRNARSRDFCDHRGGRFKQARQLLKRPDFAGRLSNMDKAYLRSCRNARLMRAVPVLAAGLMVAAGVSLAVVISMYQEHDATTQGTFAKEVFSAHTRYIEARENEKTLLARMNDKHQQARAKADKAFVAAALAEQSDEDLYAIAVRLARESLYGAPLSNSSSILVGRALSQKADRAPLPTDDLLEFAQLQFEAGDYSNEDASYDDNAIAVATRLAANESTSLDGYAALAAIHWSEARRFGYSKTNPIGDDPSLTSGTTRLFGCKGVEDSVAAIDDKSGLMKALQTPGRGLNLVFWRAECSRKNGSTATAHDQFEKAERIIRTAGPESPLVSSPPESNYLIHLVYRGLGTTQLALSDTNPYPTAKRDALNEALSNLDRAVDEYRKWGGGRTGEMYTRENKLFVMLRQTDGNNWNEIEREASQITAQTPLMWTLTVRLAALTEMARPIPKSDDSGACAVLAQRLFETRAALTALGVEDTQAKNAPMDGISELRVLMTPDYEHYVDDALTFRTGKEKASWKLTAAPCKPASARWQRFLPPFL